jgi:hypothetical protein
MDLFGLMASDSLVYDCFALCSWVPIIVAEHVVKEIFAPGEKEAEKENTEGANARYST